MMEDPDAIDEVERAEVDPGQVSALELDRGPGDIPEVAARGLEGVAELDPAKTRGAETGHMIKKRAVSEAELQYFLPAKALGVERGHPLQELCASVGGAPRESIPRLGERGRGLGVVVSHSRYVTERRSRKSLHLRISPQATRNDKNKRDFWTRKHLSGVEPAYNEFLRHSTPPFSNTGLNSSKDHDLCGSVSRPARFLQSWYKRVSHVESPTFRVHSSSTEFSS
jgi:hypothetical protein